MKKNKFWELLKQRWKNFPIFGKVLIYLMVIWLVITIVGIIMLLIGNNTIIGNIGVIVIFVGLGVGAPAALVMYVYFSIWHE